MDKKVKKPLKDDEIVTTEVGRRRFIRNLGLPLLGVAAVMGASACKSSDRCDFDDGTDTDPRDLPGRGRFDRCDTDGVR